MKKRLLALLFCGLLVTGCGAEGSGEGVDAGTTGGATSDRVTSGDASATPEVVENQGWETREVALPNLPEFTVENVTVGTGESLAMARTQFDFTEEEIHEIISRHSIIEENYELYDGIDVSAYGETVNGSDYVFYQMKEGVWGKSKDEDYVYVSTLSADFMLDMSRITSDFLTWNDINLVLCNLEPCKENQEKIYALATDVFGEELAEFLVYQNISDEYYEDVYLENTKYTLSSYWDEDSVVLGVSIEPNVSNGWNMGRDFDCYDGGYEPVTGYTRYTPSQLTGGLISDLDVTSFSNYGAGIMSIGDGRYVATDLGTLRYNELYAGETERESNFSVGLVSLRDGRETDDCPLHTMDWKVEEDGEGISNLNFEYGVEIRNTSDYTIEQVVDTMKAQIQYLFPAEDLSAVTAEAIRSEGEIELTFAPVTAMDLTCDCIVTIEDDGTWTMTLSYNRD